MIKKLVVMTISGLQIRHPSVERVQKRLLPKGQNHVFRCYALQQTSSSDEVFSYRTRFSVMTLKFSVYRYFL